jgi:hypothetical protein
VGMIESHPLRTDMKHVLKPSELSCISNLILSFENLQKLKKLFELALNVAGSRIELPTSGL